MNYAYEIRRQAEAAPRAALPAVASALWKAFGEGHVSEAVAEALSGLIEARQRAGSPRGRHSGSNDPLTISSQVELSDRLPPVERRQSSTTLRGDGAASPAQSLTLQGRPRSRAGSRPRTDTSMERRRRWAASGRLPPGIAAQFTLAEQAALAVVAVEVAKRGDCRLCHEHVAAAAGVSRSTVKAALRQARVLGLLTIEERRLARFRNDTNVICIVSKEWSAWLRLARAGERPVARRTGGGVKSATGTSTPVSYSVNSGVRNPQKGCRVGGAARGEPSCDSSTLFGRTCAKRG